MRTSSFTSVAAALWLACSSDAATVSSDAQQTFNGVGGSGAWWVQDLIHFPESVRQNVSRLLFDKNTGLGLTSYRWNMGGGGVGVNNPARAPPTYYVSPGVYNWGADPQGLYFLRAASDYGVPQLTAFVNSAPPDMVWGGKSCGGWLKSTQTGAFGGYMADVIRHLRDQGIKVNLVSPMNEPDVNFADCGQEGMLVLANQRADTITALHSALVDRGLEKDVGIIADESNRLVLTAQYSIWLPSVSSIVTALAHHTYDFPDDTAYRVYKATADAVSGGVQTWMTEVCCSVGEADGSGANYGAGYDPTIKNGLHFASLMLQSFTVANEPHYDFWTLLSAEIGCSPTADANCAGSPNGSGYTDGLIYYDKAYVTNGNYQLYLTKHFWTFKHFSKFLTPGSVRHDVSGAPTRTLAIYADKQIRLIVINSGTGDITVPIDFHDGIGASLTASAAFRTSGSEDFANVALPTVSGGTWTLQLPSMSLTSFVFSRP